MARQKIYPETMLVRCEPGTFDCLDALLQDGENRTDIVRTAIHSEIRRRAKKLPREKREKCIPFGLR